MKFDLSPWRSLKTRVTLSMLAIFLVSIWSLTFFVSRMLREDMEQLLADQQSSSVAYVAADLNLEFQERLQALQVISRLIDQNMLDHPAELQKMLDSHIFFLGLFNSGVVAVARDGTAVADAPRVAGRRGTSYASNAATQATLKTGKAVIGRALLGRVLKEPLFNINAPIRDAQGTVIGALFGVINLAKPNFLDRIGEHRYGKSGGYLIMDPVAGIIVTATDKSRVLQTLPPRGINERIDQRRQGNMGVMVAVNSLGEEVMSAASTIALPGWLVIAALPTAEAFSPVYGLLLRILWASLVLTLLAGALSWWLLRRQFEPLLVAANELTSRSDSNLPPQPLPITRQDEIGALLTGFNRLLETLAHREAALKESEAFKDTILNSMPAEIAVLNRAGVIVAVNQPWQRSLGNSMGSGQAGPRPEPGTNYLACAQASTGAILEADAQQIRDGIQKVLEGRASSFTLEYPSAAGEQQRWFNLLVAPLIPGDRGAVLSRSDITEHKQIEEEMRLLNRDFVSFLEHTSDYIYFKDQHSRFRFCSQTLAHVTGNASWRDMIGKHDLEVFPAETAQIYYEEELPIFSEGKALLNKIDPYFDAAGNKRWVSTNKWPLFDHQEPAAVVGLFGISRDITQAKEAADALQLAKAEAEQANRAKSRFLAAASHDLRQPLAALALYVGVLKSRIQPESIDLVDRIQECCNSLSELLTDLLDVSKLEAGIVAPRLSDFSVDDFLNSIVVAHSGEAAHKGVQLRLHSCGGAFTHTDPVLLMRIVRNLVSNAVRYSNQSAQAKGVLIGCRRHANKQWIEVWDTGIGIPADMTEVIFEEFRQLDKDQGRRGSGLGLAIVAKTAALLGLQIRVRSRLGRGSMFAIELPPGRARVPTKPQMGQTQTRHLRVALVEDDLQFLRASVMALESTGHEVISASSAKQLLECLGQRAPDIVLSDYRLGAGETGFQVIDALRAAFGADLPAIIITGDTDPALIRSMADHGITIYFKPVQIEQLQTVIRQATERRK